MNEEMGSKIWKSANLCFLEYSQKEPTHIIYKPVNDFPSTFKFNITAMFSASLVSMIIFLLKMKEKWEVEEKRHNWFYRAL